jgi:DNA polymerase
MRSLHIDIETYCEIDLKKAGAYRYAEDCEILLFAYAWDDEPVRVVDYISMEDIPPEVMRSLTDPAVTKKAFNAAFEISCLSQYFNIKLDISQWECTQARTAMCGLPLDLGQASKVLNIDQQKDSAGSALIRYFCIPCKPTKTNGGRLRNMPAHDPVKWEAFKEYNKKDVEAERAICRALSFYTISDFEQKQWCLDQKINQRCIGINIRFVRNAIALANHYENKLFEEAKQLTGLDNPKSVAQLKKWLFSEIPDQMLDITQYKGFNEFPQDSSEPGHMFEISLNKESIPEIIKNTSSDKVKRVLQIRQEGSKTSIKKYPRMLQCVCSDSRVRGVHHYYGANRTGRIASRLIQTQNFPRGTIKNIEPVRDLVMQNDPDWLEFSYGPIPDVLSSLLRSALVPAPGKRFVIVDYSAIEAVVAAYLANEEWMLEVFRTHGKLYETTASKMFNTPIEKITKDSPLRSKGKVSELSGQYGGSTGAFIKMGALKEGLTEEELPALVKGYRLTHLNIVCLWSAIDVAAKRAIETRSRVYLHEIYVGNVYVKGDHIDVDYFAPDHGISFYMQGKSLFVALPSGRELVYCNAGIEDGQYDPKICYWGMDQTTKKWSKQDTYGPKLFENIDQAISRDILMNGLQNLDKAGYETVLQVHDEAVAEVEIGVGSLEEMIELMLELPSWCADLPLKAAGEESFYYKK